jgi:hypothetical protein
MLHENLEIVVVVDDLILLSIMQTRTYTLGMYVEKDRRSIASEKD